MNEDTSFRGPVGDRRAGRRVGVVVLAFVAFVAVNVLASVAGAPTRPRATLAPARPSAPAQPDRSAAPTASIADGPIPAGFHDALVGPFAITIRVPRPGWQVHSGEDALELWWQKPDVRVTVTLPGRLFVDPCAPRADAAVDEGVSLDATAAALANLPGAELAGFDTIDRVAGTTIPDPADTLVVGGHPARHLELLVHASGSCLTSPIPLWGTSHEPTRFARAGDVVAVWVLDVAGTHVFVDVEMPFNTADEVRRVAQEVVESVMFRGLGSQRLPLRGPILAGRYVVTTEAASVYVTLGDSWEATDLGTAIRRADGLATIGFHDVSEIETKPCDASSTMTALGSTYEEQATALARALAPEAGGYTFVVDGRPARQILVTVPEACRGHARRLWVDGTGYFTVPNGGLTTIYVVDVDGAPLVISTRLGGRGDSRPAGVVSILQSLVIEPTDARLEILAGRIAQICTDATNRFRASERVMGRRDDGPIGGFASIEVLAAWAYYALGSVERTMDELRAVPVGPSRRPHYDELLAHLEPVVTALRARAQAADAGDLDAFMSVDLVGAVHEKDWFVMAEGPDSLGWGLQWCPLALPA